MLFTSLVCALIATVYCVDQEELWKKYEELTLEEYVDYFNKLNLSWQAQVPKGEFKGGLILDYDGINELPTVDYNDYDLSKVPAQFDARQRWGQCGSIGQVYHQGDCGSCWAYSTANMITDRMCIHLRKNVQVSVQDFECCSTGCYYGNVCRSGYLLPALQYWQNQGVVSASCKPYNIAMLLQGQCYRTCQNGMNYNADKHYAGRIYSAAANEEYIKAEISTNGPIIGGLPIYSDFITYKNGVYVPRGQHTGQGHALKVIGYGEENGLPYWLVVNTWGYSWGTAGIGKIVRNNALLRFESTMCTGVPRS